MELLNIKDTKYKLFLPKEWNQLDEDVFLRKLKDRIYKLIAVYFIEDEDNKYFNLVLGEINLDGIKKDTLKSAFDVYGWEYDMHNQKVISDDKTFDKDWSEYLLAEVLLNHCDEGDLDITRYDTFEEVVESLKDIAFSISTVAHDYIQSGKDWLIKEYGNYRGKTTGIDINEDSNDKEVRDSLQKEIEKDNLVHKVWWQKEDYGYVLFIEFVG